jgi:3-phenylpropionate/cinnamic acid dioxygenase small subunit
MEIELYKTVNDTMPTKIKVKAPDNMTFDVWFMMFLTDYNYKFPREPIEYDDPASSYSWIFYVKRSFFVPRKYIDHELSIAENRIKEKHTILAKRVEEKNKIIK